MLRPTHSLTHTLIHKQIEQEHFCMHEIFAYRGVVPLVTVLSHSLNIIYAVPQTKKNKYDSQPPLVTWPSACDTNNVIIRASQRGFYFCDDRNRHQRRRHHHCCHRTNARTDDECAVCQCEEFRVFLLCCAQRSSHFDMFAYNIHIIIDGVV